MKVVCDVSYDAAHVLSRLKQRQEGHCPDWHGGGMEGKGTPLQCPEKQPGELSSG